jgi:glycosyltransferase involved in cell wall biosynthesis
LIVRLLQAVAIASRSGKFGGPFDTSLRQAQIMAGVLGERVPVLAGHLPGDEVDDWPGAVDYVGAPVRRVIPSPGFTGLLSFRYLVAAWRAVGKAEVVHLSVSRELISVVTLAFCAVRRTAVVAQTHGMLTSRTSPLHRAVDLVLRPLVRRADVVIALTDLEERHLSAWLRGRTPTIVVLGNPLLESGTQPKAQDDDQVPIPSASVDAVFIARLHPRKRVADFVAAATISHERGWNESYVVIGPDEGDAPLVTDAARDRAPNLAYRGAVPARMVPAALRSAQVFVLCSSDEPWGNVLAQAMAESVPVVVTRSAALADAVERYGAGLVVPDRDPVALAEAVHRIVYDAGLAARLAEGGASFARDVMTECRQRDRLVAIYDVALGR